MLRGVTRVVGLQRSPASCRLCLTKSRNRILQGWELRDSSSLSPSLSVLASDARPEVCESFDPHEAEAGWAA